MGRNTTTESIDVYAPVAAQAPASNTAAVWTLAAPTNPAELQVACWCIERIICSFSGVPVNPSVTIGWTDPVAGAVTETYYLNAVQGIQTILTGQKKFPAGKQVTVTLSAGGNAISGTVYGNAYKESV